MKFKNLPIRQKVMIILLLTSGVVVALTCASFFVHETITFRQSTLRQLKVQGAIIADNSTAALAFDNQSDAQEILAAVRAEPHIVAASLYDKDGKLFSKFPSDLPDSQLPIKPETDGYRFQGPFVAGFEPVVQRGNRRLGTLYLRSDMKSMYQTLRLGGLIALLVGFASLIVAYALSRTLQKRISEPILSLAGIARAVSVEGDYSVRAIKLGEDEVGLLTDAFNQMLTRIQEQNQELKEGEERVRAVLDSSTNAVLLIDQDEKIIDWNARAEAMFGWTNEEALGRLVSETIVPARSREWYHVRLERFMAKGEQGSTGVHDMTAMRRDGTEFPAELAFSPLKIHGVMTVCVFITDITERKRAEEIDRQNFELVEMNRLIEEGSRIKGEFLASMSHELRTPLNGIIGFTEFLSEGKPGPINPKQREYLGDILNSGQHLLNLINDILDLAKVEAGKMEFFPEFFSVAQTVNEVCSVARPLAQKKRIQVRVDVSRELDQVELDPQKFKQVLFNLLSNAIKFTDEGGTIDISAAPFDAYRFRLLVKDTGIGIKIEDMDRLFREFQQLDSGSSKRYEGTGLGLALTQKILELQGGSISVESEVGKGSTFIVTLPLLMEAVAA
ncbi:MAG TPA: ATP-binding protein [Fimbriimonadaceae bacterium]|jgi:protein-histidine pros-kinase